MNIIKKIAVRIIPVGVLIFIITASIAYQRGVYDITFIERPASTTENSISATPTETEITHPDTDDVKSETESKPDETDQQTSTDPVIEFLNKLEQTSTALATGYRVTDAEFTDGMKLTLLNPALTIPNDYTYRNKSVLIPVRIPNEKYSGYTTEMVSSEVNRPLVDIYMDYILIDDGMYVTVLNKEGNILYAGFDIDYVQPAYTRDKDDIAQFKVFVPSANGKDGPTLKYYMFDRSGAFVESKYDDAADNRGLYINYPSYFGKTDNRYYRYYNNGLYGYGNANGSMSTYYKYTEAYNFSEGVAAVVGEDGILNYIQQYFYTQITGTRTYRNLSYRTVISSYRAPYTHGIESLGFYYFEHGLCRVRKREVDYSYNEQILSDNDIMIRLDGKEFPIPTEFTVVSYSNGIILLEKNGVYGCMDYTGKWIIQPVYDYAEPFNEGLGVIGKNGKVGVIDTSGNFVIPMVFERISGISGGIIAAWENSNGWAIFNKVAVNG